MMENSLREKEKWEINKSEGQEDILVPRKEIFKI